LIRLDDEDEIAATSIIGDQGDSDVEGDLSSSDGEGDPSFSDENQTITPAE
jgi:hypothetical protein